MTITVVKPNLLQTRAQSAQTVAVVPGGVMPDEDDESRERLSEAIQAEASLFARTTDGDVLIGWILVSEWMDPDGGRWMNVESNPESTSWQRMGYLDAAGTLETEAFAAEDE